MKSYLIIALAITVISCIEATCKLPKEEVNGFLSVHNRLRSSISAGRYVAKGRRMPAARNGIPNLRWDCNLERDAQNWANQCKFEHSKNRNNQGENLYTMWSTGQLSKKGMSLKSSRAWADEFQKFGWPSVKLTTDLFNSGVGHATQMAWQKTKIFGCGVSKCDGGKRIIVVCRYQDAGNYLNQNIYDPR